MLHAAEYIRLSVCVFDDGSIERRRGFDSVFWKKATLETHSLPEKVQGQSAQVATDMHPRPMCMQMEQAQLKTASQWQHQGR
jgi:hypothetical protein